jgi:glycosyltransferase involved in cell wall biosynthesis
VARHIGRQVDIWLSPHLTSAPVTHAKKVVVVHDCSFLYKDFFSLRKRYWHWSMGIERTLRDAVRIIAVSEHTRQELLRHYQLPPEKVITIYPGVDGRFFNAPSAQELNTVRAKYHLPERFILFLGTLEPRKNILTLLQAFTTIAKDSDIHLVLAGEVGWLAKPILKAIQRHPFANRIHRLGFVADEDKNALYRLSSCFAYPSLYEGFGFPPLEALACGVPVVVSHATSLPEVVGNNAITVDPYNAEDMAQAIQVSVTDNDYRTRCATQGPLWARQFSWQATAERISDIIESVVMSR